MNNKFKTDNNGRLRCVEEQNAYYLCCVILELKRKRDDVNGQVARDRSDVTSLDEQISDLERQKSKIKLAVDEKESQVRKLDELIRQSESAVNKMV